MRVRKNIIGSVLKSNNYGDFEVVDQYGSYCDIKFIETGFEKTIETRRAKTGQVKDPLYPFVLGVGYLGVGSFKTSVNGKATVEYVRWKGMLSRCYDSEYQRRNKTYKNCTVCDEWHNFQVFAKWFREEYPKDGKAYELDKDLKSSIDSKVYSPETCVFITHDENNELAHAMTYRLINPQGDLIEVFNLKKFCRDNDLSQSCMSLVVRGKRKTHKGWSAELA